MDIMDIDGYWWSDQKDGKGYKSMDTLDTYIYNI